MFRKGRREEVREWTKRKQGKPQIEKEIGRMHVGKETNR